MRRVGRRKLYRELIKKRAAAGGLVQGPAYEEGPVLEPAVAAFAEA